MAALDEEGGWRRALAPHLPADSTRTRTHRCHPFTGLIPAYRPVPAKHGPLSPAFCRTAPTQCCHTLGSACTLLVLDCGRSPGQLGRSRTPPLRRELREMYRLGQAGGGYARGTLLMSESQ